MSKVREVPFVTDSFVNRMAVRSVFYIKSSIKKEAAEYLNEVGGRSFDWEEWFDQPKRVVERLADRLAVAEDCIRKEVKWPMYRALLREIETE